MKKIYIAYFVWFVVIIAAAWGIWVLFGMRLPAGTRPAGSPAPDEVTLAVQSNGSRLLTNKTAGYSVAVPQTWYLEKDAGAGVTLYPNYDPAGTAQPACKIEISALLNPKRASISDWLSAYFREDPTADIEQQSVTGGEVSGQPAITWVGSENGVSTTLTYVARAATVYEIAPSLISAADNNASAKEADCADAAASLIETFQFLPS